MLKFMPMALVLSDPLAAQQVQNCGVNAAFPCESTAMAIAEPGEDNTRSFADGRVRIVVMDTWEPASRAYYLMVMYWPSGDNGAKLRICELVSQGEVGFVGLTLESLEASQIRLD